MLYSIRPYPIGLSRIAIALNAFDQLAPFLDGGVGMEKKEKGDYSNEGQNRVFDIGGSSSVIAFLLDRYHGRGKICQ